MRPRVKANIEDYGEQILSWNEKEVRRRGQRSVWVRERSGIGWGADRGHGVSNHEGMNAE